MKAYAVTSYKKPLELIDAAEPVVGDREVLIEVEAASLNQLDEKIRTGEFKPFLGYKPPFVLGHDVAGTVLSVGRDVTELSTGDQVWAKLDDFRIGSFAERVAARVEDVAHRPRTLSVTEAASLPLVALTAWQALTKIAQVKPGDRVLVHAGSGGVGTIAIQLAKHLGAHVASTASAKNADLVRDLGADEVIDYRTEQFDELLSGFDVVLDGVSPDSVLRSLRVLRPGGVVIGIAGPPTPQFARGFGLNPALQLVMAVLSRKARKQAARLGVRYQFLFMKADGEQLARIAALVDDGVLRPVVGKTVSFDEIPAALSVTGKDGTPGKTVVSTT